MTRAAIATLAVGLTIAPMWAQTPAPPTADQIIEKYIAAVGGRAALEKLTSMTAHGTLTLPDAGISGDLMLYGKAPNKAASVVNLAGMRQADAFDGTVGWADDGQGGVRVKAGAELLDSRNSAVFNRELKMRTIYPTMTVSGPEKVDTRDAWVIEAVPAEGTPVKLYYDVESGLQVRQVVTRQTPMGAIEVDVRLEDYRDVDGIKRPHTIRQITSMFTAVLQLTDIRHNVEIDDAVFRKPGL